jgi:hypothetical protein
MPENPMMECGCRSNGYIVDPSDKQYRPGCVVHECFVIVPDPELEGRTAVCEYCRAERPSSEPFLAFFEYRGEGTPSASQCGNCGYAKVAHEGDGKRRANVLQDGRCPEYVPRGDVGTDTFYCGCRGWD